MNHWPSSDRQLEFEKHWLPTPHGGLSQGIVLEPGVRRTKCSKAKLSLLLGQRLGGPRQWPLQGAVIYGAHVLGKASSDVAPDTS